MVGWHHQLNGHEFKQTWWDSEWRGSPWGRKGLDTTEWLNWTELTLTRVEERWLCLDWLDLLVTGACWDYSFLAWVPRAGSPHFRLLKIWEGVKSVLVKLLLHFYNNIRNNIYHFNIDKWLQTTEGGTGRNVLKQPGTRKLCFLESNTGQKAVSPGSLKHITWLRGTAKNPD